MSDELQFQVPEDHKEFAVLSPVGGERNDIESIFLDDRESPEIDGMHFDKGAVVQDLGSTEYGSAVTSGDCLTFVNTASRSGANSYTILFSSTGIHAFGSTTWSVDLTPAAGYTSSLTNLPNAIEFIDRLIITNGNDKIMSWDYNTTHAATALSVVAATTNITKAKFVWPYDNYLFALNTTEGTGTPAAAPQRVRYPEPGSYDDWDGANSGYFDVVKGGRGDITGVNQLGDYCVIFKRGGIHLVKRGTSAWDHYVASSVIGTASPRTILNIDGRALWFLGQHSRTGELNIFSYSMPHQDAAPSSGHEPVPIGNAIQRDLASRINVDALWNAHAAWIPVFNEYRLWVPTGGTSPDYLYIGQYDGKTIKWSHNTSNAVNCAAARWVRAGETWTTIAATWAGAADTWAGSGEGEVAPVPLVGCDDGQVYRLSPYELSFKGGAINAIYETKDFLRTEGDTVYHAVEYEAKGDAVSVYYSTDEGLTWTQAYNESGSQAEETLSSSWAKYRASFGAGGITSERLRLRWRNNTAGESFALRWYNVQFQPMRD